MLDRLMGRPVFSHANRVVRENMNDRQFHDCAEPDSTSGIITENQESGTIDPDLHQGHPVQDCRHRMLADPEVKIAAAGSLG